jgi:hypothetical protein
VHHTPVFFILILAEHSQIKYSGTLKFFLETKKTFCPSFAGKVVSSEDKQQLQGWNPHGQN